MPRRRKWYPLERLACWFFLLGACETHKINTDDQLRLASARTLDLHGIISGSIWCRRHAPLALWGIWSTAILGGTWRSSSEGWWTADILHMLWWISTARRGVDRWRATQDLRRRRSWIAQTLRHGRTHCSSLCDAWRIAGIAWWPLAGARMVHRDAI